MRTKGQRKNLRRTFRDSMGRFLAIALIIALGSALFVGLRTTRDAMVLTVQDFMDSSMFFDYRVLNTYGYEEQDVAAFSEIDGIQAAEGGVTIDALVTIGGTEEVVGRFHALPETINTVLLMEGRLPENENECVIDAYRMDKSGLGTTITITETNTADTYNSFSEKELTVVGTVRSPLYINFERGSSSLGTGTVNCYLYVLPSELETEVYTEVWLRMSGSYELYSEAYDSALAAMEPIVTNAAEAISADRIARIRNAGYTELAEAEEEYQSGLSDYETERADAEAQLTDAAQQLADGAAEIQRNEEILSDSEAQLNQAQQDIDSGRSELSAGQAELNAKKKAVYAELDAADAEIAENYELVTSSMKQVNDGLEQIDTMLTMLESYEGLIDTLLPAERFALRAAEEALEAAKSAERLAKIALEENPDSEVLQSAYRTAQEALSKAQSNYDVLAAQVALLENLPQQKSQLLEQKSTLEATKAELENALVQLDEAKAAAEAGRAEADAQFAKAQQQLDSGKRQLDNAQTTVDRGQEQLNDGVAQLNEAKEELAQGQSDYEQALSDAEAGFAEAEEKLTDAAQQIADGYAELEKLDEPDTYVLNRTTNVGYSCFESDADIVRNVSVVFPVFFVLIAALVCMTTMDKMVDEERSQIGTLKALGYSNVSILMKYIIYAGMASIAGAILGCMLGTLLFTQFIWKAYSIMYCLPPKLMLYFDWKLCSLVFFGYLAAMLLVTWYSCARTMRETPANLVRPKSPEAGKRLLIERLFFWKRIPFLYKVTFRNMFRYRKRLFMTLLGVGGSTALLVTGFGFRDSIIDVANHQYKDLMHYDISVNFSVGQPEAYRDSFRTECSKNGSDVLFLYQSSMDVHANELTKTASLIVPENELDGFWTIADDGNVLSVPGLGQALITRGLSEKLSLSVGDSFTATDSDMHTLSLTVAGIFDNTVSNYIIISPETQASQWNDSVEPQVAYISCPENIDLHSFSASLMNMDYVINASVTQDFLTRIDNMMKSLNYIVYLIIVMAAALAFIVLYNLTNININERIREIATIKVLGFRKGETNSYLFRESIMLAFLGSALGLVMGKYLHAFVMSTITIDMMRFDVLVKGSSYVISLVLTMFFAIFVSIVLSFRLEKINMAEALKSVE